MNFLKVSLDRRQNRSESAPKAPTTAPAKKKAPAKPRVRVPKKKTSEAK